jgi:energy-coupling factor transporter ATP-binding protein EcfA2
VIVLEPTLTMPYPGLRPFEADDAPLFFGREAQVNAMLRQLEDHRFVAVVGSSGCGKSSLVRAGLLPSLREGFLLGTTNWVTIVIKPGAQPYQHLAHALARAGASTAPLASTSVERKSKEPRSMATISQYGSVDMSVA